MTSSTEQTGDDCFHFEAEVKVNTSQVSAVEINFEDPLVNSN